MIGLFVLVPVLSDRGIPQMMKLVMALWITIILWFFIPYQDLPTHPIEIILTLGGEFFIGAIMGFITRILIMAIQVAGSFMDMQMGLSVASAFDPSTGGQTTIMSRILYFFSTVMFLLTNTHHLVLIVFFESYRIMPVVSQVRFNGLLTMLGDLGARLFLSGISIALPVILIIFMLDFSLGLLARLAPQVNVFFLGFQMKPILGLTIFLLILPVVAAKTTDIFNSVPEELYKLLYTVQVNG